MSGVSSGMTRIEQIVDFSEYADGVYDDGWENVTVKDGKVVGKR